MCMPLALTAPNQCKPHSTCTITYHDQGYHGATGACHQSSLYQRQGSKVHAPHPISNTADVHTPLHLWCKLLILGFHVSLSLNHHPGACPSSSLYLTITNDVRALTYSPSSCMSIIFNPPVPQCMHFIFIAYPAILTTQALILPTSPRCTHRILSPPPPICLPFILQGACPLSLSSPGPRRS